MSRFHELLTYLLTAILCVILMFVTVRQDETIQEQRALIQSFEHDKGCMHDPRK